MPLIQAGEHAPCRVPQWVATVACVTGVYGVPTAPIDYLRKIKPLVEPYKQVRLPPQYMDFSFSEPIDLSVHELQVIGPE